MFMMMKDFNKFVQRKMMEGKIVGHKEAGLPEEVDGHIYDDIHNDRFQEIHNVESIVNEDEGEKNVLPEEDNNNS